MHDDWCYLDAFLELRGKVTRLAVSMGMTKEQTMSLTPIEMVAWMDDRVAKMAHDAHARQDAPGREDPAAE